MSVGGRGGCARGGDAGGGILSAGDVGGCGKWSGADVGPGGGSKVSGW